MHRSAEKNQRPINRVLEAMRIGCEQRQRVAHPFASDSKKSGKLTWALGEKAR